jgi:hypothetical protein
MRRALLAFLAGAGALTACPKDEPAIECRLNSDCASPFLCADGRCRPECRDDRDCADTEECLANVCEPRVPPTRVCNRARDCKSDETCRNGICEPVGLIPPPDAGVQNPRDSGAQPPHDAGQLAPDSGIGPTGLPYGAICMRGSECASTFCLGIDGGAAGRCTKVCAADNECVYPDTCIDVGGAGRLCGAAPTGGATGAPCPGGPAQCATGICLGPMGGSAVCTHQCSPLPSCPMGMTCQPVPDGAGSAVAVCIPGTGGGFGQSCGAPGDCATALCVGITGSGVCTSDCNQTPCPSGWTCARVADGQGGFARICAPEGIAGGDFGDPCTGATSCASMLCLSDGTGQSFCTDTCRTDTDCPVASGWSCVTISGGARVCAP